MKENLPFGQINKIIEKHRNYLGNSPRYERFMTRETVSEWTAILGPDVLSLTHGSVTADVAKDFISFNKQQGLMLSEEQEDQLLLAAHVHDFGEIMIDNQGVGDVTFENKNSMIEKAEERIFNKVVSEIEPESEKQRFLASYKHVMNRDTKMGELFNAIERVGHLKTAIKAFIGAEDGRKINNWKGLVGNVLSNQIRELVKYSDKYPYISFFLVENKTYIESMFRKMHDPGMHVDYFDTINVPRDNGGLPSFDQQKLQSAYDVWKIRKNNLSQCRF